MTQISFSCDRCGRAVEGLHTAAATGGFYDVSGLPWSKYAKDEFEHFVCDECVQSSPRYREDYGK